MAVEAEAHIQGLEFQARNLGSLQVLVKKHGVKLRRFSDEMLKQFGTLSGEVVAEVAAICGK